MKLLRPFFSCAAIACACAAVVACKGSSGGSTAASSSSGSSHGATTSSSASGSAASSSGAGGEGTGGASASSAASTTSSGASSSGVTSSGASSSGASSSSASSSSSSASSTSSSSGACALPDPTGKSYLGVVLLARVEEATAAYSVIGDFVQAPTTTTAACSGTLVGACCYETTPSTTTTAETAGTLTVKDGTKTLASLTSPSYVASSATDASLTWAAGATLDVAATGGTLDAFSLSVVAPELLAGVTPSFASAISVSKSAKLVVSWTPSSQACAQVIFDLSQTSTSGAVPHIACTAADSDGTLTVPEELVAKLTATAGNATIERFEAAGVNVANTNVKVLASDTKTASVTYTP